LRASFPKLYSKLSYFEISDGWFDLVYRLSGKLEKLITQYERENKEGDDVPHAVQVKQKYGGLVLYMSSYVKGMDELIQATEKESYNVCEVCGRRGKIRNGGWIQTLCEEHSRI
jgi:hypothetical protein